MFFFLNVKVKSGHVFVVLGAHVRVLSPIIGCHSNANFACTIHQRCLFWYK